MYNTRRRGVLFTTRHRRSRRTCGSITRFFGTTKTSLNPPSYYDIMCMSYVYDSFIGTRIDHCRRLITNVPKYVRFDLTETGEQNELCASVIQPGLVTQYALKSIRICMPNSATEMIQICPKNYPNMHSIWKTFLFKEPIELTFSKMLVLWKTILIFDTGKKRKQEKLLRCAL